MTQDQLGAAERRFVDGEAELIAGCIVDKLMARLSDEKTVDVLVAVWTAQFDRSIGRTFRRGLWFLLTAAVVFFAIKFEMLSSLFKREL